MWKNRVLLPTAKNWYCNGGARVKSAEAFLQLKQYPISSIVSVSIFEPSMQFSKIINQQGVKQQLVELIQHNRLSHALLFLSKEGSGALSLALALAQYLTCEKANPKKQSRYLSGPNSNASLFEEERLTPDSRLRTPDSELLTDSCGICASCIKANQLIHPDIHFSYPVVTKKSGTPPLSADYITEWREFVKDHPYGNVYDWLQFIGAENKQGNITANECNDIIHKLSLKSFESEYKMLIMWMPEYLGATKETNCLS